MIELAKVDESAIQEALASVMDPELGMSVTELNLVDKMEISPEGDVNIDFHLTAPFCPPMFAMKIAQDIKAGVSKVEGVRSVRVNLTEHYMAEDINKAINA